VRARRRRGYTSGMLIAEELVLLSLHPERGTALNGSGEPLKPAVAGALIAELALAGAVTLEGGRFVTGKAVLTDPLLLEALAALGKGKRSKQQLTRMDKALGGARDRVVDRLIDAGALGRDKRGALSATTHPLLRPEAREEPRARVRAAAAADGEIEARTAVLLALCGPVRLLEVVADKPHDHAKRRIAQATELTPVAPIVKKVIQEAQMAVAAASTAATAGAVVST